ncbi:MAG TPA: rubrerythrin family protein [Bellilinea sp.]|nr:rubrerythrin family protein [Bellilinea sp.]
MELKGSKTEQNLMAAFAGESQATNKYEFYAVQARKEGYEQIADFFEETMRNERAHAKIWFKYLHDGSVPPTEANLVDAAEGEHYEFTDMYVKFAEQAKEEGFNEIAGMFKLVGDIEKAHHERYSKLLANLRDNHVFLKDGTVIWVCRVCGYVHVGKTAPKMCPVCKAPQGFFEVRAENY